MKYKVNIKETSEGYAIWVPGFPGCWSQGETEERALENVKDAIKAYLETIRTSLRRSWLDYVAVRDA